jgi:hypothetical protein
LLPEEILILAKKAKNKLVVTRLNRQKSGISVSMQAFHGHQFAPGRRLKF